jgi:hypothetical protein
VKLLFDALDSLLLELRDRKVGIVRVSPVLEIEMGPRTGGTPHVVSHVLVTAALGHQRWAEWRHRVGQIPVEDPQFQVPAKLREQQDRALAEVARRVDDAGFQIREGILTENRTRAGRPAMRPA